MTGSRPAEAAVNVRREGGATVWHCLSWLVVGCRRRRSVCRRWFIAEPNAVVVRLHELPVIGKVEMSHVSQRSPDGRVASLTAAHGHLNARHQQCSFDRRRHVLLPWCVIGRLRCLARAAAATPSRRAPPWWPDSATEAACRCQVGGEGRDDRAEDRFRPFNADTQLRVYDQRPFHPSMTPRRRAGEAPSVRSPGCRSRRRAVGTAGCIA